VKPNDILLVENMDRFSRLGQELTQPIFTAITNAGVHIHIMSTDEEGGKTFKKGWFDIDELANFFLRECSRARGESKRKSELLQETIHEKKLRAVDGEIMSSQGAHWLTRRPHPKYPNDRTKDTFEPNEHAATVVLIFKLIAYGGLSAHQVVEYLDENKIKPIGHSGVWNASYIYRLFRDKRVLGEFQPVTTAAYKNGEKNFDPVTGKVKRENDGPVLRKYYPQVVTPTLHEDAVAAVAVRKRRVNNFNPDGSRKQWQGGGRISKKAENLFPGIVFDATVEGSIFDPKWTAPEEPIVELPMHLKWNYRGQPKESETYYYFLTKYEVRRTQHRIHYSNIEKGVLKFLEKADWRKIAGEFETVESRKVLVQLNAAKNQIKEISGVIADYKKAARLKPRQSGPLFDAIEEETKSLDAWKVQKKQYEDELEIIRTRIEPLFHPERLLELIKQNTPEAYAIRVKLRLEIRKMMEKIVFRIFDDPRDGHTIVATLHFINGSKRRIIFRPENLNATLFIGKNYKETITFDSWHGNGRNILNNESARRIFELRIKNLTLVQISKETGFCESVVGHVIRGQTKPNIFQEYLKRGICFVKPTDEAALDKQACLVFDLRIKKKLTYPQIAVQTGLPNLETVSRIITGKQRPHIFLKYLAKGIDLRTRVGMQIPHTKVGDKQKDEIIALHKQGLKYPAIGLQMSLCSETVGRIIRLEKSVKTKYVRATEDQAQRAYELIKQGFLQKTIGKMVGITPYTVGKIRKGLYFPQFFKADQAERRAKLKSLKNGAHR
jgi:hypothetical protein